MSILIPRFSAKPYANGFWRALKRTWIGPHIQDDTQLATAGFFLRDTPRAYAEAVVPGLFQQPVMLKGAGYSWESRRPLQPDPSGTSPVVTSGANTLDFNVMDFCSVLILGVAWQVAGTVTALVADYDKYPSPGHVGTVVDKLDTVNGVLTAPSIVASQAAGQVITKDVGNVADIDLNPGNSVQFIVTTTTSAGSVIPFVLVVPRAEVFGNLATWLASA